MSEERLNYDAAFCSKIPLHQTNEIQPQGILLVVNKANLQIIQASANVAGLFGIEAAEITGKPLAQFLEADCFAALEKNKEGYKYALPGELHVLKPSGVDRLTSMIHEKDQCLLIEMELPEYFDEGEGYDQFFIQLQHVMASLNQCNSVEELARVTAAEVKRLSGFDKVMVYSFDEEWVGTIIGEQMEAGMDSYLGLRFPASDIPRQARELYLKNPYRLIPDRDYIPVPLVPETNPLTKKPTNLSDCKFRSVLGVHLEYLRNMNVVCSMSTRIIHKEQLWGLIACHHRSAKQISFRQAAFFEFLSNVVSSRVASIMSKKAGEKEEELHSHYTDIITQMESAGSVLDAFDYIQDQLLLVLAADGVALCWEDEVYSVGIVPESENIRQLKAWLAGEGITHARQYQALPYHFAQAKQFSETGSGLLVLPVQPYEGNFILAFRGEVVKKVSWGGDPRQVLTFEPNSSKYHPRHSFDVWQETVRHTAEPWLKEELDIAERLRIAIVEFTLLKLTSEHR